MTTDRDQRDRAATRSVWGISALVLAASAWAVAERDALHTPPEPDPARQALASAPAPGLVAAQRPRRVVVVRRTRAS